MSEVELLAAITKCQSEYAEVEKVIAATDPTNKEALYKLTAYKMTCSQNIALTQMALSIERLTKRVKALEAP